MVKNLPATAGDLGSFLGSGRSPGEGHDNPLQYYCLENPMNRGAWRATAHGVTKSRTWLKWLSTHVVTLYFSLSLEGELLESQDQILACSAAPLSTRHTANTQEMLMNWVRLTDWVDGWVSEWLSEWMDKWVCRLRTHVCLAFLKQGFYILKLTGLSTGFQRARRRVSTGSHTTEQMSSGYRVSRD